MSDMWFETIPRGVVGSLILKSEGVLRSAQRSPLPAVGDRRLEFNQLTSLEVGVFDKNTALNFLYV